MKFILNGCDISFIAEAPDDITLKQLLKQCDKIKPDWSACGGCGCFVLPASRFCSKCGQKLDWSDEK